jgi:hypothetical protein
MFDVLLVASGLFWTVTYLLIIRQGFLDKRCGMPLIALCANLSWEFLFAFPYPHHFPQVWVNRIWFTFDLIILAQLLLYWRNDWPGLTARQFYARLIATLALALAAVWALSIGIDNPSGAYAAFAQNLLMSILFLALLRRRGSALGQSRAIAWCKMIGTAFASAGFLIFVSIPNQHVLLPVLYFSILAVDLAYIRALTPAPARLDAGAPDPRPEALSMS